MGNNTTVASYTPVQVCAEWSGGSCGVYLTGVADVSAGFYHSLALKEDGTLWGWGRGSYYALGIGYYVGNQYMPAQACVQYQGGSCTTFLTGVTKVDTYINQSLSLLDDGTLRASGYNYNGQVGVGNLKQYSYSPLQVGIDDIWGLPAAGRYHSAAPRGDGTLWAWGENMYGQLGHGSDRYVPLPTQEATGASDWSQIIAGDSFTIALKSGGTRHGWGWGVNNSRGDGATADIQVPEQMESDTDWSYLEAAGHYGGMAGKNDGTIWGWGDNRYGQARGNGSTAATSIPTLTGLAGYDQLAAGYYHTIGLKSDGTVWGWGDNRYGQLGDGTGTNSATPVQVCAVYAAPNCSSYLINVTAIAAGSHHSLALKSDDTIWGWGLNTSGQLGHADNGANQLTPVQVCEVYDSGTESCATPFVRTVAKLTAGNSTSMVLLDNGEIWGWGSDNYGQVGSGTALNIRYTPLQGGFADTDWFDIVTGNTHTLATKSDGTLWSWGYGYNGEAGNGTLMNHVASPAQVCAVYDAINQTCTAPFNVGDPAQAQLAAGISFSQALKSDGTIWSWGVNTDGVIGNGDAWSITPVEVDTSGLP